MSKSDRAISPQGHQVTDESGEVAFTVEVEGQEPTPHSTLQDAVCRVEGYESPTGAIFYTLFGAHRPVIVYRDGDIDSA